MGRITPILKDPHWLQITQRIEFNSYFQGLAWFVFLVQAKTDKFVASSVSTY